MGRIGGIAGIVFVVLVVATFFLPETPDADDRTLEIARQVKEDRDGLIAGIYISGIASALFLFFTAGLWARLRAGEPERGASVVTLLAGLGSSIIIIIGSMVLYALIDAADDGREPAAIRALFELSDPLFIGIGFTTIAFYAGVALSARAGRTLPAPLYWLAAILAVLFTVALLGLFSEDDDGGVLGGIFFLGLLINFVWILATSIVMLRGPAVPPEEPVVPGARTPA